jgi:putative cardiolipin synthase
VVIARAAQRSLDLQYYIWHADTTGALMAQAAWEAAERGVRVRMLLDDANTKGFDETLAALDAHPKIEVRLFNPFANRGFRLGDFATDFSRVNRRMHNKSFTADNQVTIVGGRNIGNEYFGADPDVGFQDLDVIAIGPVVREVSHQFDLYWNSPSAYPVSSVIRPVDPAGAAQKVRDAEARLQQDPAAVRYLRAVRETPLLPRLLAGDLQKEWAAAHVIHDDPSKVLVPPEREDVQLLPHLTQSMGKPLAELDLVSPYFVPGKEGTEGLVTLARSGVKVRVLTNSLAATDVSPVHAGYAKYRTDLLRGGVQLYELKRTPSRQAETEAEAKERRDAVGSSGASLHAKTFGVDRSRIFVGSFNLDPRSARLNTEMGVVIASPSMTTELASQFDKVIPEASYEVRLKDDGSGLQWIERTPEGEKRLDDEPSAGFFKRLWIGILGLLPIEWLL